MYQKIIVLILSGLLLAGCSDGFRGYFKKSANDKWIDSKGFKGSKRKPLYNTKYIALAKKNVMSDNIDEDDEDDDNDNVSSLEETSGASKRHRQMYMKMIKHDAVKKNKQNQSFMRHREQFSSSDNDRYPSLAEVSRKIASEDDNSEKKLQQELAQIKSMLVDARKDLARYKCPMATNNTPGHEEQLHTKPPAAGDNNNITEAKRVEAIDNSGASSAPDTVKSESQSNKELISHEPTSFNNIADTNEEQKAAIHPSAI